jgi:hypothetical protein
VRADFRVVTVCVTLYLSPASSLITVIMPSAADANAKPRLASNATASHPSPMAGLASSFRLSESTTAIFTH